jgi:hypothetical protein
LVFICFLVRAGHESERATRSGGLKRKEGHSRRGGIRRPVGFTLCLPSRAALMVLAQVKPENRLIEKPLEWKENEAMIMTPVIKRILNPSQFQNINIKNQINRKFL